MSDLPAFDSAFWYAEGSRLGDVPFSSRLDAVSAAAGRPLVLWSSPPSPELLRWLLDTLDPSELYLVGRDTAESQLDLVLKEVAGMAKWSMGDGRPGAAHDGLLPVARLAARIGATEAIVRHALLWLEQKGILQLRTWEGPGIARVDPGDGRVRDDSERTLVQTTLEELLAETRAYRRFFQRAQLNALGLQASVLGAS